MIAGKLPQFSNFSPSYLAGIKELDFYLLECGEDVSQCVNQ